MNKGDEKRKDKKLGISFGKADGFRKYVFGDTIDELIDGLEVLKDGRFINYFVCKFPDLSEKQLMRLDIIIPQTKEGKEIYNYLCKRKKVNNITDFEDALIRTKELRSIKNLARDIEGANIRKLEKVIIDSGDAENIYYFAEEIKGADLLKLKKALLETRNAFYIAYFCSVFQEKEGIINYEDIKRAEEIIIQSQDALAILKFATHVNGANIEKLEEAMIKTGVGKKIFEFADSVKTADINKLRKAIKKTEDSYYIKEFYKKFGKCSRFKNFFKDLK